jgi:hypothetical protein
LFQRRFGAASSAGREMGANFIANNTRLVATPAGRLG